MNDTHTPLKRAIKRFYDSSKRQVDAVGHEGWKDVAEQIFSALEGHGGGRFTLDDPLDGPSIHTFAPLVFEGNIWRYWFFRDGEVEVEKGDIRKRCCTCAVCNE
jgi:hypothetical protein